jgi:ribosomal protein L40E
MAKRNDSVIGSVLALVFGGIFVLFWIGTATKHGAPFVFPLFGFVFLGLLVFKVGGSLLKSLDERNRNESAPVLTSEARVAAKRTDVVGRGKSYGTQHYATFELPAGQRVELELGGDEYGQLAEGDRGELRYQGSWYLGFLRRIPLEPEPPALPAADLVCEYCGALNSATARKCSSCGSSRLAPPTPKVEE